MEDVEILGRDLARSEHVLLQPGYEPVPVLRADHEDGKRRDLVRDSANQIVSLVQFEVKPRDIVTQEAIDNAIALDMAMGGSTNTILHTLAIAHEAGVPYPLKRIHEIAEKVPHLCKVSPSSEYHIEDVDRAGGVRAILKELTKRTNLIHLHQQTVCMKTVGEIITDASISDDSVIHPMEEAFS